MLHWIVRYIEEFIDLSLEMAPWLLLGFIFAGILHVYMPKGSIRKYMGGKNLKSVIYASLLGIPLPLCSCGVIPTGIAFHKEGASKGSTVSFLISTPQTGVDSILATYSLLGLPFAILRPIVAFFSGIFGGAITNSVTRNDLDKQIDNSRPQNSEDLNGNGKFKTMLRYAFHDFLMDIAKWLIIGLAIAALIAVLLPNDFFVSYLHNEFLSMLIVLAASIPLYVCATGSIPIAAVLMMKEGMLNCVITQNIDNLHQQAGSKVVHEFHGNSQKLLCVKCNTYYIPKDINLDKLPPKCSKCDGLIKPDFVFFGEGIPTEAYKNSVDAASKANVVIIIGSTGEVMPAAQIPYHAKQNGATIIEVNPGVSNFTNSITDIYLEGKATEVMGELKEVLFSN